MEVVTAEQDAGVASFLKNWNPKGVVAADAAHIEGMAPLPATEVKTETPATPAATAPVVDPAKLAETPAASATEPPKVEEPAKAEPVSLTEPARVAEAVPAKTFEQLLEEKTAGKYKSYEDIEKVLNEPKKNEYKSALAERIDAYVEQGGTEEDYLATQSVNFDTMSPTELIEYKIQLSDPDMTDEEVAYEMKKQYGIDKWKNSPAEYEDGIEPEEVRMNKLRFNREALRTKAELIAEQKEWAVPVKKEVKAPVIDPSIQKRWESEVSEAIAKFEKIPLKISDAESYDFVVDATEKAELTKMTNELFSTTKGFFDKFRNDKGEFDKSKMAEAFFKMSNFEKAVAFAAGQAKAKGSESVVKEIKNTNFTPEGKTVETKKVTTADAIKEQALKIARGEA